MRGLWIARVVVSEATRRKVAGRHGIDVDDLVRHLVAVEGLAYRWDDDPVRGLRAVVALWLGGRRIAVVLYPATDVGDDCFRLGSAYAV